ncbi:MAG TPA: hypothetical protein VLK84_10305 [Longimicrobium sp.]|nr:hypothetical protein [Longimicrobium sp.]
MKTRLFLAATLSLAVSACAPAATTTTAGTGMGTSSAPASAATVNPVGRYEFATSVQGQPVTGGMTVGGTPGAYTGQITTSITPPLPISSVTATGQQMVVTGSTPDGALTIRVNFTDATAFTGSWELSGDSGSLTGRRVM